MHSSLPNAGPPPRAVEFPPPVDTASPAAHCAGVDKKPHKVEEPQAAYTAKKPAKVAPVSPSGPNYAALDKVRANNDKLIQVHRTVLQKLAQ